MSDINDDQDEQIARLLDEDSAPTSELHDARIRAAIEQSATKIQAQTAGTNPGSSSRRVWAVALAASLVAAMVVVFLPSGNNFDDDVVRSLDPGGEVSPTPESTLANPPERFAWPPQSAATSYRLTLRDNTGSPIWTTTSNETEIVLDGEVAKTLIPNVSYIWSVTPEGDGPQRELGPYWFRIQE